MSDNSSINIHEVVSEKLYLNKNIYRSNVGNKEKYIWEVLYKQSDLLISSDKDIKSKIYKALDKIYRSLELCIKNDSSFFKSLYPIKQAPYFPKIINEMCEKTAIFNVGPMAAVAGTVCEYMARALNDYCGSLIIENGGDVYIKSKKDKNIGVYVKNKYFKNKITLKVSAKNTPCGICSSSGVFGHSLSLGQCDLAVVSARSIISADGAATAVANMINSTDDIKIAINHFKKFKSIEGILIIKDNSIGFWGDMELVS